VDLNRDELVKVPLKANYSGLGELWLPRSVLASDIVVSMPKIKTHHWAGVTLSLKNMFGIVPGMKYGWPKHLLHWAELHPRWDGERQREQEQMRRAARSERFRNMSEWATWPKLEVVRFLKSRARGHSIHELEDWILQTANHHVLFRDERAGKSARAACY
jgi:hypothetical protein